jgi:hypothetical protein
MKKFDYQMYFYPGKTMSDEELNELTADLKEVATACFDELPNYQVLTGKREEFERAVIIVARDKMGRAKGFCSSLVFPVEKVGNVLHLGLTCVHPSARGKRLTHKLSSKLLLKYLLKESPMSETWVTNCACVLSSLGNVAMYFEDIYPSPYGAEVPTMTHVNIAKDISRRFREPIAINEDADFNMGTFVFEGSVDGTSFQKDSEDQRYHHRNKELTKFYQDILNFDKGDEVLQVGKVSMLTFPKYIMRNVKLKTKKRLVSVQEKFA